MGSMVGCFDLGIVGYALELESDETRARGVRVWVVCWEKCEGSACLERCEGSASLGSRIFGRLVAGEASFGEALFKSGLLAT